MYRNATLFDLLKALKRAVQKAQEHPDPHIVTRLLITVEEKSEEILHTLRTKTSVRFFELIGELTKMHVVVTFLALLELAKNHRIVIQQDLQFDDIIISARIEHENEPLVPEQEQAS